MDIYNTYFIDMIFNIYNYLFGHSVFLCYCFSCFKKFCSAKVLI